MPSPEENILIQAYSRAEALDAAGQRLGKERSALKLSVLRCPGDLFGLHLWPGLYRISYSLPSRRGNVTELSLPTNGTVGIQQGKVIVTDPSAGGKPALIVPDEGVTVRINGVEVLEPTPVTSSTLVELTTRPPSKKPGGFILDVSSDCMSATLRVFPEEVVTFVLEDQPPTYYLIVSCNQRVEKKNTVTFPQVLRALQEERVIWGIDEVAIQRAVMAADGEPTVVARGAAPEPGKNGQIRFHKLLVPSPIEPAEEEAVNYWEKWRLPMVQAGEIIACVEPAVPGKPGMTVKGEVLPARSVKEARYILREHEAALAPDGRSIVARKNGRPIRRITENGIEIGVMGIYVRSGNVNLSSGNLTFTGDVLVLGNVEQGARAEAGGKLIIRGNSSDSFLLGNAGVEVDGYLIKVRACAGLLGWFSAAALAPVRQLSALWQMAREKNLLDENHLKLWQHAVFDLKHIYQELELEESYFYEVPAIAAHSLTSIAFFRRHRAFPQDVLRLVGLNLEKLEDKLLKMRHEQADLILRWAWGSTLKAASSVVVTDARGCFDCGINAGGKVTIHGAVRRSWITAHDDIRIRGEVGSPLSEEEVLLQTEPEGCVYLAKAYPGVQVRFGRRTLELQEETSASCFYLDRVTYKIRKTTFREWLP